MLIISIIELQLVSIQTLLVSVCVQSGFAVHDLGVTNRISAGCFSAFCNACRYISGSLALVCLDFLSDDGYVDVSLLCIVCFAFFVMQWPHSVALSPEFFESLSYWATFPPPSQVNEAVPHDFGPPHRHHIPGP